MILIPFLFAVPIYSLLIVSDKPYIFSIPLGMLLLLIAYRDLLSFKISNLMNLAILILGIIYNIYIEQSFIAPFISFVIAGSFFYLLSFGYFKIRRKQGLGGGDIKLFACGAVWLSPYLLPLVLLTSSFSALFYALFLSLLNATEFNSKSKIPFGPFLGLGLWICWLFGENIINFISFSS